jgi:triacylglycerol lipase
VIKDFKASDKAVIKVIAREVASHLVSFALFPLGITPSQRRTPRRQEQRTVVFVHGYMMNRACFLPLYAYLRAKGFEQVLSFNYKTANGIEQSARELKKYLSRHVRGGRVDLVCHSLGGIVARLYIQELGGSRRVDRCITLSTPHKGTYSSYWVFSRVGNDMRPDSALLTRLESSRSKAPKVKYTSIVAGSDNIVVPRVFAVGSEDIVHVPDVGHLGILFSPRVYQIVAERLLGEV